MKTQDILDNVSNLSIQFSADRQQRQSRTTLDKQDFDALHDAGYTRLAVPESRGGNWLGVPETVRPLCVALRSLAAGDSCVALVSAMHPAVLSYWLTAKESLGDSNDNDQQFNQICDSVLNGDWFGTITSEPGSGGDVANTKAVAKRVDSDGVSDSDLADYLLSGQKHFGSGSGVMSYMVTTALPSDGDSPDWFFVNTKDCPWDGSTGMKLVAEWDGHGMIANQSHAFEFQNFPAHRISWPDKLKDIALLTGPFIGCLFASVIVGISDAAMQHTQKRLDGKSLSDFESVQWTDARKDAWLIQQSWEGMIRAVQDQDDPRRDVLTGKTVIGELSEQLMTRLCRISGGSSYSKRSPLGYWFEDVRALGFLRPPWSLAYSQLEALP